MVAVNKTDEVKKKLLGIEGPTHVKFVNCPVCGEKLTTPRVLPVTADKYGRQLRQFFGWCFECEEGQAAIQYKYGDIWATHKYQKYIIVNEQSYLDNNWIVLRDQPEVPLVMTGPGGDYLRVMEVQDIQVRSISVLSKLGAILGKCLSMAKAREVE